SFTKNPPKLLGTVRKFRQHGQAGTWVGENLPHIAGIVDDITVVRSMATEVINHAPAKLFTLTGSAQFGRPSIRAWATYRPGSEGPARLRRPARRPARPPRWRTAVGLRLPADGLSRGAIPCG